MDAATNSSNDTLLDQARALVEQLEAGNDAEAERLIEDLGRISEQSLFCKLGKMTRQLHDALNGFELDERIHSLAQADIPDARLRLNHVIDMTEDSANRTLSAVESTLPVVEQLQHQAVSLDQKWDRFRNKDMQVEEFRDMSREIGDFLGSTREHAEHIHGSLSEVMMAQDFQDLTGQIIRRVISLVQEVDDNLVSMIRLGGGAEVREQASPVQAVATHQEDLMQGVGPQVPGTQSQATNVSGQDEVDDLLSSLGF